MNKRMKRDIFCWEDRSFKNSIKRYDQIFLWAECHCNFYAFHLKVLRYCWPKIKKITNMPRCWWHFQKSWGLKFLNQNEGQGCMFFAIFSEFIKMHEVICVNWICHNLFFFFQLSSNAYGLKYNIDKLIFILIIHVNIKSAKNAKSVSLSHFSFCRRIFLWFHKWLSQIFSAFLPDYLISKKKWYFSHHP